MVGRGITRILSALNFRGDVTYDFDIWEGYSFSFY